MISLPDLKRSVVCQNTVVDATIPVSLASITELIYESCLLRFEEACWVAAAITAAIRCRLRIFVLAFVCPYQT